MLIDYVAASIAHEPVRFVDSPALTKTARRPLSLPFLAGRFCLAVARLEGVLGAGKGVSDERGGFSITALAKEVVRSRAPPMVEAAATNGTTAVRSIGDGARPAEETACRGVRTCEYGHV